MIKRHDGANLIDVASIKRFDGSNMVSPQFARRFDGSNFVDFFSITPTIKGKVTITTSTNEDSVDNGPTMSAVYAQGDVSQGTDDSVQFSVNFTEALPVDVVIKVQFFGDYSLSSFYTNLDSRSDFSSYGWTQMDNLYTYTLKKGTTYFRVYLSQDSRYSWFQITIQLLFPSGYVIQLSY